MSRVGTIIAGRPLFFAESSWSVRKAASYMTEKNIGAVPIIEKNRLVGIFSERDLMARVVVPKKNPDEILVKDVMTSKLAVAGPDEDFASCLRKMHKAKCRHLPIVSNDQLIGTISLRELLEIDLVGKEEDLRDMTSYIYQTPQQPS